MAKTTTTLLAVFLLSGCGAARSLPQYNARRERCEHWVRQEREQHEAVEDLRAEGAAAEEMADDIRELRMAREALREDCSWLKGEGRWLPEYDTQD